jgi:SAM-dependent methyltransferase
MKYGYCTQCGFVSLWGGGGKLDAAMAASPRIDSPDHDVQTYRIQEIQETRSVVSSLLADSNLSDPIKALLLSGMGKRYVDVGCGAAGSLAVFERAGWSTVGIEPRDREGDFARARGQDVRTEPYSRSSLEPASTDMIYSYHSIEHFNQPFQAINNFAYYLRPGGLLYIECPDVLDTTWRQLGYDHLGMFSPATLGGSLRSAGFEILGQIDRREFETHGVAFFAQRTGGTSPVNEDHLYLPSPQAAGPLPSFRKMQISLNYAYFCGRTRDLNMKKFPIQMLHLLIASKLKSRRLRAIGRAAASRLGLVGASKP